MNIVMKKRAVPNHKTKDLMGLFSSNHLQCLSWIALSGSLILNFFPTMNFQILNLLGRIYEIYTAEILYLLPSRQLKWEL